MNLKFSKYPFLIGIILILSGMLPFAIGMLWGVPAIQKRINTDTYTIASRVELNEHWLRSSSGRMLAYSPTFYYNVGEIQYSCSGSTPSHKADSSIKPDVNNSKVFYNSKSPELCISEYDFIQDCIFGFVFLIIALALFVIGLVWFVNGIKQCINILKLIKHGQLIKNIPCRIIPANISIKKKEGYIIELEYNGQKLKSEAKFDIDVRRNKADLLIDPLDSKIYFIGFNIA